MVVFWFQQKDVYSNHVLHKSYLESRYTNHVFGFSGHYKVSPRFPRTNGLMHGSCCLCGCVFSCVHLLFNLLKIRCLLFLLVLVLVELQVLMFLRIQLTCPDQRGRFHPLKHKNVLFADILCDLFWFLEKLVF